MDSATFIQLVLASLLGAGGVSGLLNAIQAFRSRRNASKEATALPSTESGLLNAYLKTELIRLRNRSEARHAEDEEFIEILERHIWEGKPPPPPSRPKKKPLI